MLTKSAKVYFKILAISVFFTICILGIVLSQNKTVVKAEIENQPFKIANPLPAETPEFNQQEALAKLREQIKGKEKEPAGQVFKNIQMLKEMPAGRLLMVMEMGYSRSLGVNCTHCHTPEKWEAEDKTTKQIAREMAVLVNTINNQSLKNIKNLKSQNPVVNCATCHRGEVKPAINVPQTKP